MRWFCHPPGRGPTWVPRSGYLKDEREVVANNAAFAVAGCAERFANGGCAPWVWDALREIAEIADDSRVVVRIAAAYVCGKLSVVGAGDAREAAGAIVKTMDLDVNAMVSIQLALGRTEGKRLLEVGR
jgi:hypothetical protein